MLLGLPHTGPLNNKKGDKMNITSVVLILLNFVIILLILDGFRKGKVTFTTKKMLLGLLVTILVINLIFTLII